MDQAELHQPLPLRSFVARKTFNFQWSQSRCLGSLKPLHGRAGLNLRDVDLQNQMKQAVAEAAVEQFRDGMIVGLGSGSTAALMIQGLGQRLASGQLKDIVGVTTSFQGEVLAAELGIPLLSLNAVDRIDLAIDGADEVDPSFQLIKGGGACHVQEKLVAARADRFIVVVDSTKLVDRLNLGFLLPVEVLPGAWRQVQQS